VRFLALLCCAILAPAAVAAQEEPVETPIGVPSPAETPISVPSPIPVGFLVAWKPTLLSLRVDSGAGSEFGSDKLQLLRGLGRWTTTMFGERLMARAELEGGQFQSDPQGSTLGTNGVDLTARLLGGTATRISPGFIITASAGLITRYQWGAAEGGAPRIGMFGLSSNIELEYRVAPLITISAYLEGALTPWPYAAEKDLGDLSDASEFRLRFQVSLDVSSNAAVDLGYDFTRWHATFSGSTVNSSSGLADQALLLEAREHAITFGIRWKP
jgi:hypothetical protein